MVEPDRSEGTPERSPHTFQLLKSLADGVARTFGGACEVVIHDFADLEHSVVHVAGSVTERSIGAPPTNLVLRTLRVYGDEVPDLIGYRSATRDGHELKSSTIFVRDPMGKPIGCLCINFDLSDFRAGQLALNDLLTTVDPKSAVHFESEEFADNVATLSRSLIDGAVERLGKSPAHLAREERLALISELEDKGLFLVKGAIEEVAGLINASKHTVYRYLDEIRGTRK